VPRTPKGIFFRLFREAGLPEAEEKFDLIRHHNCLTFLDLLESLEGIKGPLAARCAICGPFSSCRRFPLLRESTVAGLLLKVCQLRPMRPQSVTRLVIFFCSGGGARWGYNSKRRHQGMDNGIPNTRVEKGHTIRNQVRVWPRCSKVASSWMSPPPNRR